VTPGGDRARARDLGLAPGTLPPGPVNAVTDVPGIRVGHATLIEGADIRTGVTAVVHDALIGAGQDGTRALAAGLAIFNGFGKMVGSTQVSELGTIETPVLLTATLSVFRVADALLSYLHHRPAFAGEGTLNPVVAETNDGYLSDIWARPIGEQHVRAALDAATSGPVAEGCVGAGTGTRALGFKAGIGTSSRLVTLPDGLAGTLGALVQANFGGVLTIGGVSVPPPAAEPAQQQRSGGSCVIVLATDVPLGARELRRVANRAFAGMARAGADFSGRSGDYALAISTAGSGGTGSRGSLVPLQDLDVLFTAAIEATEEAILNSLLAAVTTTGYGGRLSRAVSLDEVRALVAAAGRNRPAAGPM
jgi:D-aminopeptidase